MVSCPATGTAPSRRPAPRHPNDQASAPRRTVRPDPPERKQRIPRWHSCDAQRPARTPLDPSITLYHPPPSPSLLPTFSTCSEGDAYLTGAKVTSDGKEYDYYTCCTSVPAGLTSSAVTTSTAVAWSIMAVAGVASQLLL